ncbi:NAD-dependent epimerase/dehydratase family protein [Candidatus Roizmanbacteria bacterium]|nr:NAD-dependent epimerase/dehydratase family protein [Candidatus Roizmanbacteria bacterium]
MSATKKVCITGNNGFLGHHFIKEAKRRGWYSIGVDKRPSNGKHEKPDLFIQTDVRDLGYRDLLGVDYIVHLAFVTNIPNSVRHPKETAHDNICMTQHLLEVAKETGTKKFAFPSTASLYSNNPTPWTEDMKPEPIEPYSWQKLACEQLCRLYSRTYGVPTVIFRFFQIFGEFQREDTALAAFLKAKAEGRPITLTETMAQSSFRSGQRDFIYAGDVAEAVFTALESGGTGGGEIFNVSSGEVHTMEEIVETIGAEVKWIPRREYEVERHHGDITKIKALGWKPKTDIISWLKK